MCRQTRGDLSSPAPTARPLPYGARLKLLASGDPPSRRGGGHGGAFARRPFVAAAPSEYIKRFDLISTDRTIIGDAKFMTLVGGTRMPPAKFHVIVEHVWLLEKTPAERRFLVFGNQIEVPRQWLQRHSCLVDSVEFFFLHEDDTLETLR